MLALTMRERGAMGCRLARLMCCLLMIVVTILAVGVESRTFPDSAIDIDLRSSAYSLTTAGDSKVYLSSADSGGGDVQTVDGFLDDRQERMLLDYEPVANENPKEGGG